MALSSVEDYVTGKIKKHELNLKKNEDDRTKLTDVQGANSSPVFLFYKDGVTIDYKVRSIVDNQKPYSKVVSEDYFEHTLWLVSEEDSNYLEQEFAQIPHMYIADGHHRAAAAMRVANIRNKRAVERGLEVTGEEEHNYFMTIIYAGSSLQILDCNRAVKSLNGLTPQAFLDKLSVSYAISELNPGTDPRPKEKFIHGLRLNKKWYELKLKEGLIDKTHPRNDLDAQVLEDFCLRPILGIEDLRTDYRVDFIGGKFGYEEIERRCDEDCEAGFAMYPVSMEELLLLVDSDMQMPPKCTWFEPKPRSGFVVRVYDQNQLYSSDKVELE